MTITDKLADALRALLADIEPTVMDADRDARNALAAYDAQQAVAPIDSGPFVGGLHIELFGDDESPDADEHGYALQSNGTRICDGLEEDHARRIVQCVNAHDALVSALQTALGDLQTISDAEDGAHGLTCDAIIAALAAAGVHHA